MRVVLTDLSVTGRLGTLCSASLQQPVPVFAGARLRLYAPRRASVEAALDDAGGWNIAWHRYNAARDGIFFATSRWTHLEPRQFFGIAFWIGFSINKIAVELWLRARGRQSQRERWLCIRR